MRLVFPYVPEGQRKHLGLLMFDEAEKHYLAVIETIELVLPVQTSSMHFDLGDVLLKLGDLYRTTNVVKAEAAYLHADGLFHKMLRESHTASTINAVNDRLCSLYLSTGQLSKARHYAEAEVNAYRLLSKRQPDTYGNDLARSLIRLAVIAKAQNPADHRYCALAQEATVTAIDWEIKIGISALGCVSRER
jgi:hypothetical protein